MGEDHQHFADLFFIEALMSNVRFGSKADINHLSAQCPLYPQ